MSEAAYKNYLRRQHERELVAETGGGAGTNDFGAAGPPSWDRRAWDAFRVQYGRDPFNARELPPELHTAPAWVFERMGLRPPFTAQ